MSLEVQIATAPLFYLLCCGRRRKPDMDLVSSKASFTRYDIRTIIKFLSLLGKPALEIHQMLVAALGECAPSIQTVRKWMRMISEGRLDMDDEDRSGRPTTVTTDDKVAQISEILKEDRRQTCAEIAERAGVSVGTAHTILTQKLHKKKLWAKWVPHLLSDEQRAARVRLSAAHLRRHRREGDSFLSRIVAGDETWVYSWDPELKRQSAEWRSEDSPRPQKARRKQGSMKVMHIIFFDMNGILLSWPVPVGTTVNGLYYQWVLREKLRPAIRKKRPQLLQDGVILLHDNAPAHCKKEVVQMLEDWDWEVLPHPPYSPDLSPCDFFLFHKMKIPLRGIVFDDEEAIKSAVQTSLQGMDKESLSNGISRLVPRWEKCKMLDGSYVE
jgi:histone-lysine N-methyltransferase SETMAR